MDTVNTLSFDPALSDPTGMSLLIYPMIFHVLILLIPGIVAYYTWQIRRSQVVRDIREIRTHALDLTPGERAFVDKEELERTERGRRAA